MWLNLKDREVKFQITNPKPQTNSKFQTPNHKRFGLGVCLLSVIWNLWFVLFLSGCGTFGNYNAATGHREFIAIPTNQEVSMGQGIHQDILKKYRLCTDQSKVQRVERIGLRVAQISDRQDYQYHFYVLESDDLNAFTTPGGSVYLYTGLLDKLTTDDQVAAVIAHEIGHCAARHTIKKYQAALGYQLVGNILLSQIQGSQAKQVTSLGSNLAMNLVFSAYGRGDEYEADRLGIKYLYLAGYDLEGMVETLGVLKQASKGSKPPLILSSHPYVEDRIEEVKKEIVKVRQQFKDDS